jgi:hypothetical protein
LWAYFAAQDAASWTGKDKKQRVQALIQDEEEYRGLKASQVTNQLNAFVLSAQLRSNGGAQADGADEMANKRQKTGSSAAELKAAKEAWVPTALESALMKAVPRHRIHGEISWSCMKKDAEFAEMFAEFNALQVRPRQNNFSMAPAGASPPPSPIFAPS